MTWVVVSRFHRFDSLEDAHRCYRDVFVKPADYVVGRLVDVRSLARPDFLLGDDGYFAYCENCYATGHTFDDCPRKEYANDGNPLP